MFAVGDRVYLSKSGGWTWSIEMRENYDKTEQVVSFVDSDNTFKIEANPVWWFHFSDATLIERGPNEPVAEVEDDEDDSDDYVTTNNGDSILREDAFETELDGWVHRDNLLTAQTARLCTRITTATTTTRTTTTAPYFTWTTWCT